MTTISESEVMEKAFAVTPNHEVTEACSELNESEEMTFTSLDELNTYLKSLRRVKHSR